MTRRKDGWRLQYHLMPPSGWLNDPNGLCQYDGIYHIFFQYSPAEPGPDGRMARTWGHYAGPDLLHLRYRGVPFWPVDPEDHDGCYSGSALTGPEGIRLYYTGNVKEPGKDLTYEGRQANEILVESDGETFGDKRVLLRNVDYPPHCTCHVRDPKVWREDGVCYMVLGARVAGPERKQDTDYGEVLFYRSADGVHWDYLKELTTEERFGYMWECPDYFSLEGRTFLGVCPQGLSHEEYRRQNIYQSGYFEVEGGLEEEQKLKDFREWDMGFDFYAPQSFVDEAGRRLFIGWVGLPDRPYGNPTADLAENPWENCLTVPRVLTYEEGVVRQNPIPELEKLRYDETDLTIGECGMDLPKGAGDFEVCFLEGREDESWNIRFGTGVTLSYSDNVLKLEMDEQNGRGRKVRKVRIEIIEYLRILVDSSVLEIYVNDGEYVLTSRFYPAYDEEDPVLRVSFDTGVAAVTGWRMQTMETNRNII